MSKLWHSYILISNELEQVMLENQKNKGLGIIFIVLGAFFFLSRYVDLANILWPFYIIVPGIMLFVFAFAGGRKTSGLVIPASIVTTIGLILFSQNITNNFKSWVYTWALIPASSGLGMLIMSNMTDNFAMQEKAYKAIKTSLLMFLAFGVFFELFIFRSWMNSGMFAYALPIVLILAGLFMLKKPAGNYVYLREEDDTEEDDD